MQGLPAQAQARFDAALAASRPNDALRYLEGLQVVAPGATELASMRQRLAAAYVGVASERLGRGEMAPARQALERAAELEPNHIELPALRARLEQAGG
jgi:Tfp pilus assembly protein PilF